MNVADVYANRDGLDTIVCVTLQTTLVCHRTVTRSVRVMVFATVAPANAKGQAMDVTGENFVKNKCPMFMQIGMD